MSTILKDKMLNYQQAPPEGLWDSIAFKLDTEEEHTIVAQKLKSYEVTPPAFIWENITTELDKQEDEKVITITPKAKVFKLSKIAVAASVLLLLTTSIWFVVNNKKTDINQPLANTPSKKDTNTTNNIASVTPSATENSNTLPTSDTQEKNTVVATKTKTKKVEKSKVNDEILTTNQPTDLATNPFDNKQEKLTTKNGDVPESIDLVNNPNTYLTIVGPNGQSVKISSKFSKQLGLFTETDPNKMENIDFIIKESALWRGKIAAWRKKMNLADVSPSMDNFMDIIELSKKIDGVKKK